MCSNTINLWVKGPIMFLSCTQKLKQQITCGWAWRWLKAPTAAVSWSETKHCAPVCLRSSRPSPRVRLRQHFPGGSPPSAEAGHTYCRFPSSQPPSASSWENQNLYGNTEGPCSLQCCRLDIPVSGDEMHSGDHNQATAFWLVILNFLGKLQHFFQVNH